jgi:hypothetical protein
MDLLSHLRDLFSKVILDWQLGYNLAEAIPIQAFLKKAL